MTDNRAQIDAILMLVRGRRLTRRILQEELLVSYRTASRYIRFMDQSFPELRREILDSGEQVIWLNIKFHN